MFFFVVQRINCAVYLAFHNTVSLQKIEVKNVNIKHSTQHLHVTVNCYKMCTHDSVEIEFIQAHLMF